MRMRTKTKTQTKTTTTTILGLLVLFGLVLTGCESQNTYAKLRETEKQVISDYIEREHINVLNEVPEVWGEKDYYKVPDYDDYYIHVVHRDTTARKAKSGDYLLVRYKKYGLEAYSDTTRYWTTDDGGEPIQFQLGNTADTYYIIGWTVAMTVLEYSDSQCKIICPSKMGTTTDNSSVTPYGYELKFKIKP